MPADVDPRRDLTAIVPIYGMVDLLRGIHMAIHRDPLKAESGLPSDPD